MATAVWEFITEMFVTDKNLEEFIEAYKNYRTRRPVDEVAEQIAAIRQHYKTLSEEEKCKFLEECRERERARFGPRHEGKPVFQKATDQEV